MNEAPRPRSANPPRGYSLPGGPRQRGVRRLPRTARETIPTARLPAILQKRLYISAGSVDYPNAANRDAAGPYCHSGGAVAVLRLQSVRPETLTRTALISPVERARKLFPHKGLRIYEWGLRVV